MPVTFASTPSRRQAESRLASRRRAAGDPRQTPLVWAAVATGIGGLGAIAYGVTGLPPSAPLAAAVFGLVAWLLVWRRGGEESAEALLLAAIALAACGWTGVAWRVFSTNEIGRYAPHDAEPVCLRGVVTAPPQVYPPSPPSPFRAIPSTPRTVVRVWVEQLRDGTRWSAVDGLCEVTLSGEGSHFRPGDRLLVYGQLARPSRARNPGERDAAAAARAERRLARVWTEATPCVLVEEAGSPSPLDNARKAASDAVDRRVAAAANPVVRAMVLGDRSSASNQTIEAFRRTGVLHVLVVSGLHVGIVAAILPLLAAAGLMPRRTAWAGALVVVAGYAVLVGGRPPAARAAVVAAGVCVATLSGRRAIGANSLAGAAVFVFCVAPGAWVSAGTRLSFLATAVLMGVAWAARQRAARPTPPLERLIHAATPAWRHAAKRFGRSCVWAVGATAAVQVATWPLVASEFHLVSPAAGPLALVITPLAPLVVGGGMAAVALDAIAGLGPLADAAGWLAGVAAIGLDRAVGAAAELPGAGFYTAGPAVWWAGLSSLWLGLVAAVLCYVPRRRGLLWRSGLALAALGVGPLVWRVATRPDAVRCTVLAVGHGASTLLEFPDGRNQLVDAGALGEPDRVADTIARSLWARGVTRLDGVLLTHADLDHYNALPGLLDRLPIDTVWTTPMMFEPSFVEEASTAPAALQTVLQAHGTPIRELVFGDRLPIGDALLEVLHPDEIGVFDTDNANSLVIGVVYQGRRLLLPGDLEGAGIERLLAQEPYDCDVLLAPHHGSERSDPPGLADWSTPEVVAISSGAPTRKAAADAYQTRDALVLNTHTAGQLQIELRSDRVRVYPHLGNVGEPAKNLSD